VHPILLHLCGLDIHTYGVLVAIGFIVGLWAAARKARNEGLSPEQITDLGVWLIVAGMAGGKLFHVIFVWDEFIGGWRAEGVKSLREGFVFYGGFIGACLATIIYTRTKRLPLWKVGDACAPGVALGHAFGRLGCFFNGCCYGKACSMPWAVRFPEGHFAHNWPVHPTQLYEAAGNIAIFAGLSAFYRHKRFDGQVWWLYVLSYGLLRFGVEFFRGDYDVRYFGVFALGHIIAAIMIIVALVGLKLCRRTA
jgi:phosphatidylglycerol:prolipoprotein diacylglycerol transferase